MRGGEKKIEVRLTPSFSLSCAGKRGKRNGKQIELDSDEKKKKERREGCLRSISPCWIRPANKGKKEKRDWMAYIARKEEGRGRGRGKKSLFKSLTLRLGYATRSKREKEKRGRGIERGRLNQSLREERGKREKREEYLYNNPFFTITMLAKREKRKEKNLEGKEEKRRGGKRLYYFPTCRGWRRQKKKRKGENIMPEKKGEKRGEGRVGKEDPVLPIQLSNSWQYRIRKKRRGISR